MDTCMGTEAAHVIIPSQVYGFWALQQPPNAILLPLAAVSEHHFTYTDHPANTMLDTISGRSL